MNCKAQDAAASITCPHLTALAYHIRSMTYNNCRFGICSRISILRDEILQATAGLGLLEVSQYCVMQSCSKCRFSLFL